MEELQSHGELWLDVFDAEHLSVTQLCERITTFLVAGFIVLAISLTWASMRMSVAESLARQHEPTERPKDAR